MMGLREEKKENRKERIFESAIQLFAENGFEKTTMEAIAAGAGLGVGTLYNYFSSKVELFFFIISTRTDKYGLDLDWVIADSTSLHDSVSEFYKIYLQSFATYEKRIWREILGEFLFKQPSCMPRINMIDIQFNDKLRELLIAFQKKGMIKAEADLDVVVSALYAFLLFNIFHYVTEPEITETELLNSLNRQAELILGALLPA